MSGMLPALLNDGRIFEASAGPLLSADFTTLAPGTPTLPAGWAIARESSGDTVQTSAATIASGIVANTARVGSDGTHRGLVIEETRTNILLQSRITTLSGSWINSGGTRTAGYATSPDGSTLASRIQVPSSPTGVFYQSLVPGLTNGVGYTASAWYQQGGGASDYQFIFSGTVSAGLYGASVPVAWTRYSFPYTGLGETPGFCNFDIVDNRAIISGAPAATAKDNVVDLVQFEQGSFPTEAIVSGVSPGTRAGEHCTYTGSFVDGTGRLSLWVQVQPKGGSSQYTANMRLATIDANNYLEIDSTSLKIRSTVGGVAYVAPIAMSWSALDTLDIFVAMGGGSLPTQVQYRVNGGATQILSFGVPPTQGAITPGSSVDVLCAGTANQFSAYLCKLQTFRSGAGPAWITPASVWTPANLPGVKMWLRGDKGISLSGSNVTGWADQSGNGNNVSQAAGINQPTYGATMNGVPVVSFGAGLFMSLASKITMPSGVTFIAVYRTLDTTSTGGSATSPASTLIGDSTSGTYSEFGVDGGKTDFQYYSSGQTGLAGLINVADGNAHMSIATYSSSSSAINLFTDTVAIADASATGQYTTMFEGFDSVGCGYLSQHQFNGDIAEIIVCTGVLGPTDLANLQNYVEGLWGTTVFSPSSVTSQPLELWLDPAFKTLASGRVSAMADRSGLGNNASQSIPGTYGPVWNSANSLFNNQPTCDFTRLEYLQVADASSLKPSAMTAIAVMSFHASLAFSGFFSKTTSSGWSDGWVMGSSIASSDPTCVGGFTGGHNYTSGVYNGYPGAGIDTPLDTPVIVTLTCDGSSTQNLYVNGVLAGTRAGTTIASSAGLLYYGSGDDALDGITGSMGWAVLYGGILSANDFKNVHRAFGIKYGIVVP